MSSGPVRVSGIALEQVGDGFAVVDSRHERIHYLNHTAAYVLELCTGTREPEEIARVLQRGFDLSRPPDEDVRECLRIFRAEGLVV
jgi:hypothetical protein